MATEETYRPVGAKMIVRLEVLAGIGLLCYGAGVIALSDIIPLGDLGISALGKEGLVIYGSVSIVLGVLSFLVALGIWSMDERGRKMALLSCIIGIFLPIVVAGYFGKLTFFFNLIVYPLILYYLSMESVKENYEK